MSTPRGQLGYPLSLQCCFHGRLTCAVCQWRHGRDDRGIVATPAPFAKPQPVYVYRTTTKPERRRV